MKRSWLVLVVLLALISQSRADDPKQANDKDKAPVTSSAEKFKANPGDREAFTGFFREYVQSIQIQVRTDPAGAEKKLNEMTAVLDAIGEVEGDAKRHVDAARNMVSSLKNSIELEKIPLPELEKQLDANPHDVEALSKYFRKISSQLITLVRSDPEKAEKLLTATKQRLEKGREGLTEDKDKKQIESYLKSLAYPEKLLESAKRMLALIGQDAAPLDVQTWVNGSPLTDADLKGKVVFLDFWAVWCGPCIATFPHLREWQEKYGDKGLVMIGVTNYYKTYDFDEEKGTLKKAAEPLSPEAENQMLERFAAHHKLHHRFAVAKDGKFSEYYAVSGIPHVVIIDQQGKVRMMKVGSGEANAKALNEMLESLLSKAPAAGG